jgi:hypothetical protein
MSYKERNAQQVCLLWRGAILATFVDIFLRRTMRYIRFQSKTFKAYQPCRSTQAMLSLGNTQPNSQVTYFQAMHHVLRLYFITIRAWRHWRNKTPHTQREWQSKKRNDNFITIRSFPFSKLPNRRNMNFVGKVFENWRYRYVRSVF